MDHQTEMLLGLITDKETISKIWTEIIEQLLKRLSSIDCRGIEEIPIRPHSHIKLDDPPTEDEVSGVIAELQHGKSASSDGIPHKVLKLDSPLLIQKFTQVLSYMLRMGMAVYPEI